MQNYPTQAWEECFKSRKVCLKWRREWSTPPVAHLLENPRTAPCFLPKYRHLGWHTWHQFISAWWAQKLWGPEPQPYEPQPQPHGGTPEPQNEIVKDCIDVLQPRGGFAHLSARSLASGDHGEEIQRKNIWGTDSDARELCRLRSNLEVLCDYMMWLRILSIWSCVMLDLIV